MRAVAHHHVRAGVDSGVRDQRHVVEHILAQAPVARGDENIHLLAQRGDVILKKLQLLGVGPGDDFRRNAGAVGGRDLRARFVHRHLIGGVAAQCGDTGSVRGGFVVGRPVNRGALQKAVTHAIFLDNCRRVGGCAVGAGAGMLDADFV